MKSLREQLGKLFNRPIPDPKNKSERPPKNKDLKAKKLQSEEKSKRDKKNKAGRSPAKVKRKPKQKKLKKLLRKKIPSLSDKAIHDAYHPTPSRRKLTSSLTAQGSEQREGQNQRKLKVAKPYGQQPSNQCVHCDKPAMAGFDVCLRCSHH